MNARLIYRPLAALGAVLFLSAAGARPATSVPTLYDVTGHWIGTASRPGHGSAGLDLTIQAGEGTAFSGQGVLTTPEENAATIQGTANRTGKFKAQLNAPGAAHVKLTGKVHPNTNTVTGSFSGKNGHNKHIQGTFQIVKQL
jgi:hypothetical protein